MNAEAGGSSSGRSSTSPLSPPEFDAVYMRRALELAARGRGAVEPNPMVGCVVVNRGEVVGEGWHRRFGEAHAEVEALRVAGARAAGATLYVTLEPCCHHGKTPPCTRAILAAGVRRVVAAQRDPFPAVSGKGLAELAAAGLQVDAGPCEDEARWLNAPYLKLLETGRPWVIAKWAMTLDGKIATVADDSRWISCEASRAIVHEIRGRMDAIVVGRNTVKADDPLLTARPAGPRVATRIVLDSRANLSPKSQLVRTAAQVPVLVATGAEAPAEKRQRLADLGCEVFICEGDSRLERVGRLLKELGRRRMTNLLVEGGGQTLGSFFACGVDEAHVFIAPKIFGGIAASGPVGGEGILAVAQALELESPTWRVVESDLYISGRIKKKPPPPDRLMV